MKAVILAGGYGTRISEESGIRPKPMVEIGGKPILWHVMKIYSAYGINDFIICCGYKGYMIKEYFANYCMNNSDVTFDMQNNRMEIHRNHTEPWQVTLIHTGFSAMTGGRLRRVRDYIGQETFCMTYGDGVSDVNIADLVDFHRKQKTLATLTAVKQPGRFGIFNLSADDTHIKSFQEKPSIDGDDVTWEREPLENLAKDGQLSAYRHLGFWHPMDTLRDKNYLEEMWQAGKAPWYNLVHHQDMSNHK